jgi:hypothetical protein
MFDTVGGGYQSNAQVEAACILVNFIGSSIQLFHRFHLHELADHSRLVFLQSLPRSLLAL